MSLPSSYRSRRGHIHLLRVLPLVGCLSKTPTVRPIVVDYSTTRRLVVDYFASAARPGASAHSVARHADHRATHRRLPRIRRASGCLGTSRGSSLVVDYFTFAVRPGASACRAALHVARRAARRRSSSRRLIIDYFAYAARLGASARRAAHRLSSTTSPTPCDRVPRHVARLVAWLVRRSSSTTPPRTSSSSTTSPPPRPGASARLADRRAARRRLLRLCRASGCLGTSRGSSRVVDYFAYVVRLGASARHAARRVVRCATHRRLLRLCRASGCLDMSRGSSRGSSRRSS
jgi:hypothetical protein